MLDAFLDPILENPILHITAIVFSALFIPSVYCESAVTLVLSILAVPCILLIIFSLKSGDDENAKAAMVLAFIAFFGLVILFYFNLLAIVATLIYVGLVINCLVLKDYACRVAHRLFNQEDFSLLEISNVSRWIYLFGMLVLVVTGLLLYNADLVRGIYEQKFVFTKEMILMPDQLIEMGETSFQLGYQCVKSLCASFIPLGILMTALLAIVNAFINRALR
jgi:hypothetical protein